LGLKTGSIVLIYFKAEWAKQANAEHALGPPQGDVAQGVIAYPVKVLDLSHSFGVEVQSIAPGQPKGNEIRMLVPWQAVISMVWRPNMEAHLRLVGLTPSVKKR
jgi:hypothetical protein